VLLKIYIMAQKGCEFNIMTWNVDSFVDESYKNRLKQINHYNTWDILVLVEAGFTRTEEFIKTINKDYNDIYDYINVTKPFPIGNTEQGISIIWNKNNFKKINESSFTRKRNRENFANGLVTLEDNNSKKMITLIGIHLKSWPCNGPNHTNTRLEQIDAIKRNYEFYKNDNPEISDSSLIITGDFNHPLYVPGNNPVEIIKSKYKLNNVFEDENYYHPNNTTMNNQEWLVDYMLVSDDISRELAIPTTYEYYPNCNDEYNSDHYPLFAKLKIV